MGMLCISPGEGREGEERGRESLEFRVREGLRFRGSGFKVI